MIEPAKESKNLPLSVPEAKTNASVAQKIHLFEHHGTVNTAVKSAVKAVLDADAKALPAHRERYQRTNPDADPNTLPSLLEMLSGLKEKIFSALEDDTLEEGAVHRALAHDVWHTIQLVLHGSMPDQPMPTHEVVVPLGAPIITVEDLFQKASQLEPVLDSIGAQSVANELHVMLEHLRCQFRLTLEPKSN